MGDSSYMAPDPQPVHDIQKSNTLKENHAVQNGINIVESYAANIEKGNLLELPTSSEGGGFYLTKSHLQQNGYHEEMEECKTYAGKLESEPARIDTSTLDKKDSISLGSQEARQEDLNGDKTRDCSLLHVHFQEGMQEVTVEETSARAPVNISGEDPAVNQVYPCSSDSSNVILMGGTMEDENVISSNALTDNIIRGEENVVPTTKALNDGEKAEERYLKEKDGVGKETERPDESLTESLTPPCISTENNLENDVQPPLFHSVNESRQRENEVSNEPGGDLEVSSLTNDVHSVIQNEVNLSKGAWRDQGSGVTMVISTDLEGWHRFDAEEVNAKMDHTQGSKQRLELWEKLLDDGLDGCERDIVNPPLQLAIAPSPFVEEYKFGLASPGNPFIEGLERVSSFSEADGFAQNRDLPSSGRLSQSFEEPSSFQWREGQFHNISGNDDVSSVIATVDGETSAVQLESINEHGSNLDLQLPSSRKPLSSFDAMEPFEAPSFMSLVDPKSHALFEASMPTFQASSTGYGQENGGEKWVANFDLMAPSTQEITRSSSMPRSGSEAPGQRPGQSFSFGTSREQEHSKKESNAPHAHRTKSGFLSPKFSPIVQKVVDKVRTTPAVANGVLNSVRHVMVPKTSDNKSTSKSLFTRCICW